MTLTPLILALAMQTSPASPYGGSLNLPDGEDILHDRQEREAEVQSPTSRWLAECLALLEHDASRAHTMAQIQRSSSSGADRIVANHCLGLAATELSLWEDAITAFAAARDDTPEDEPRAKARFGTMAGNAALASGDAVRAEVILRRAKADATASASAPLQGIAASDLARTLVAQKRSEAALAELDFATHVAPEIGESWLLKATLLRRLNRLQEAQSAIETAGEKAPLNPQIGLEAGVIAILAGHDEAARSSWQSVLSIAPGSTEAQTAQDYLAQLGPPPQNSQAQNATDTMQGIENDQP